MGKTLQKLTKSNIAEDLILVAGKKGLDREIKWVSTIEDVSLIRFSNEGYLNFVTGLKSENKDMVMKLTKAAYEHNLAGIVFAVSEEYIKQLPADVIDFGNNNDFPIFIIHWETKISELTRRIGMFIFDNTVENRSIADILQSILLKEEIAPFSEDIKEKLTKNNIDNGSRYRVAVFKIISNEKAAESEMRKFYNRLLQSSLCMWDSSAIAIPMKKMIALVLKDESSDLIIKEKFILNIAELIKTLQTDKFHIKMGIGREVEHIYDIAESYEQAMITSEIPNDNIYNAENVYEYEKLGVYKLISQSKNKDELKSFAANVIGELIKYDEANDTDYYECLHTFIKCGCNVKDTSECMYIHKNTVNYKLKKIEVILNCELTSPRTIFDIRLAMMIKDII